MKTTHTQVVQDLTEASVVTVKRWIGDKPKIQYVKQNFVMPSQFAESDNMPGDPEQADWSDINE